MSKIDNIIRIQDLFDRWRALGSLKLDNGVELVAEQPEGGEPRWMHVIFPGLSSQAVHEVEDLLDLPMPPSLRAFYRGCGGMTLFGGAFTFYGRRGRGFLRGDSGLEPSDLVAFQQEVAALPWVEPGAVAFASNGWDGSVYVVGMGDTPDQVLRCERASGEVTERHIDVFACAEARLYRQDELAM